jgi:LPXTG-site transpeptidase (sortase) family protein
LLLIAVIAEAIEYPWVSKGNETELPDPPMPAFEVLSYEEYLKIIGAESTVINITGHETLPGGNSLIQIMQEALQEPETGETTNPVTENNAVINMYVLLGSVKIPRINISENLFLGTDNEMNHGIGHLKGTPMPGEKGNSVIAAHRTSTRGMHPFRHINLLRTGDAIIVSFGNEIFTYSVYDSFIVSEDDTWVLQPATEETHILTLVTCDPVVTTRARDRLIVRARLVN